MEPQDIYYRKAEYVETVMETDRLAEVLDLTSRGFDISGFRE